MGLRLRACSYAWVVSEHPAAGAVEVEEPKHPFRSGGALIPIKRDTRRSVYRSATRSSQWRAKEQNA